MTENNFEDDDLFDSRREYKNEYSTFIEELQESTQKLMNQVFNTEYVPQINEQDLNLDVITKIKQINRYKFGSANATGKKNLASNDFNSSKCTIATKCSSGPQLSDSFVNFLVRNQKWTQRKLDRVKNQHNRKQQQQMKGSTFTPSILRASKQKIMQPIYQRCFQIQKQKEKKLAIKRIQKQREMNQKESQYSFQPTITTKAKNRTLDQYLKDKQQWNNRKVQYIQHQKLWQEARRNQECIFHPVLINRRTVKDLERNAPNRSARITEKVEDRLLRSLEKSVQKKQQLMKKIDNFAKLKR